MRAEFLAMVGHELRMPLTSIKGAAATVIGDTSGFSPAEMMQFFHIIDRQADQMNSLINDLLDAARIETGPPPVNPEPVPVAALVEQARSAFTGAGSRHTVRVELPPNLPSVMADPTRLVRVLSNLLANAARRSPDSFVVRVSAVDQGFQVAVSVEDQGSGPMRKRLFPRLRESSRPEEDEQADVGLDLAMSRGIVEAHGGHMWAESNLSGGGARFTFTIPVAEETAPRPSTAPAGSAAGVQRTPSAQVRILAVDDDPRMLRYLHDTLAKSGYAPVVAGDPEEALDLMEASEPHLVLLDLVLPGTDGLDLMQDIRTMADVPVIFISAYGQEDVVARAFDMGADDYVVKPFSTTELAARIRAALRRRTAAEPEWPSEPYVRGDLVVDFATGSVCVAGRAVRVTAMEYRLLTELAINAGRALTHRSIMDRVWGQRGADDLRPMRSAVRSLRHKLGDDAGNPVYIFTEPRIGYRMAQGDVRTVDAE